jgi:hypothetical protein
MIYKILIDLNELGNPVIGIQAGFSPVGSTELDVRDKLVDRFLECVKKDTQMMVMDSKDYNIHIRPATVEDLFENLIRCIAESEERDRLIEISKMYLKG